MYSESCLKDLQKVKESCENLKRSIDEIKSQIESEKNNFKLEKNRKKVQLNALGAGSFKYLKLVRNYKNNRGIDVSEKINALEKEAIEVISKIDGLLNYEKEGKMYLVRRAII